MRLIPRTVDDAIADIATVFHWSPMVFDEMDLDELMQWHQKAYERAKVDD